MKKKNLRRKATCADPGDGGLIRAEEALSRIVAAIEPIQGYEQITLSESVGRVLHQSVLAPIDVPSRTNSAVDGYAINADALPEPGQRAELAVVGTAWAGKSCSLQLKPSQTIRIMTGAVIPDGADTVLMQEHVEQRSDSIRIDGRNSRGENIRRAGEDLRAGETVLSAGRLCTPADIGLLASIGAYEIQVKRRPRIALFSTGDEIHNIGTLRDTEGVFDSNRYTLGAALSRLGVETRDMGIVADNKTALRNALQAATLDCDVIITSGGVSVGQADYTKAVLNESGTVRFWKVAIKPGRPMAFGAIGDTTFFGLPGNPVAVMVTFYRFVLPALEKIMGIRDKPLAPTLSAISTERIRKKSGRTEIQRGILQQNQQGEWQVRTTGKQGSGILRSMCLANAFIVLPHDSSTVEPGDSVTVQPFAGLM